MSLKGLALSVACAALLGACGAVEESKQPPVNCGELSPLDLQGIWTIRAEGRIFACENPRNNGLVEIEVRDLQVYPKAVPTAGRPSYAGTGEEADAFVERIRQAEIELLLDQSMSPEPVSVNGELLPAFSGGGSGCELYLDLREGLPNDAVLDYAFSGFVVDYDRAVGTFTGTGPGSCKLEGEFEVRVR
jgi:hypothetical protein